MFVLEVQACRPMDRTSNLNRKLWMSIFKQCLEAAVDPEDPVAPHVGLAGTAISHLEGICQDTRVKDLVRAGEVYLSMLERLATETRELFYHEANWCDTFSGQAEQSGRLALAGRAYLLTLTYFRRHLPAPGAIERVITMSNNFGLLRKKQGRYDEAETLYWEGVRVAVRYGAKNFFQLASNNLSVLYFCPVNPPAPSRAPEGASAHSLPPLGPDGQQPQLAHLAPGVCATLSYHLEDGRRCRWFPKWGSPKRSTAYRIRQMDALLVELKALLEGPMTPEGKTASQQMQSGSVTGDSRKQMKAALRDQPKKTV
jgi:hypothetical protein